MTSASVSQDLLLATKANTTTYMDSLRVACLQMDASADLEANLACISAAIHQAATAGVDILLTPECALAGYPGAARDDFDDINWCAYDGYEDLVHTRAQNAGIAVLLGSISQVDGHIYNDALFCGDGVSVQRYHKRCPTPFDRKFFRQGSAPCLVSFKDWQLGLTICYDVRFPHTWGDLVCAGADAILSIAHMAGPDPDPGVKATVVPNHYSSRAAEWATPLVMCNTDHKKRWLDSGAWDPRGMPIPADAHPQLRIFELLPRLAYDPWYASIHADAVSHFKNSRSH